MVMSSTMNETIKGMSGLGWAEKNKVMSLASEVFPSRCLWNTQVEKLSRQWEIEFWSRRTRVYVVGDRNLGITGITLGAKVMKDVRLHVETTEYKKRRQQRTKPAFKGLWQTPSLPCPYVLSAHCFQMCQGHPTETLLLGAFSQVEVGAGWKCSFCQSSCIELEWIKGTAA